MLLIQAIVGAVGLSLGSFLGACAYRIPRGISLVTAASSCPNCHARLSWSELIPLLSYALQRGRCRTCGERIPRRYPLCETIVAGGTLLLFWMFGLTTDFLLEEVFFLAMILVFAIDWEFQIIPNKILLTAGVIGIALRGVVDVSALTDSILSAFLAFGITLLIRAIGKLFLGKESLGLGDVKLACVLGFFLGLKLVLVAFWAAAVMGAAFGLLSRRKATSERLPFGSFLAVSSVLVFMFDQRVLRTLSTWVGE